MAGSSWSLELLRDPMLQAAWATLLAIVFAIAAAHKLRDRDGFLRQLAAYQLLPQPVLLGVVIGLLALECMTVASVTWGATRPLGMALAALLLTLYASAMAINLGRGRRDIDCGCGGHAQRLDWLLVGRNGVMVLLTLCLLGPATLRPIENFDYVAGLAISLGLYGVYCVVDELIRQAGRLRHLNQ